MALNLFLKRSGTASKRPTDTLMSYGELNLNYDSATGGLFYKDNGGNVVKVGPAQVGTTQPNSTPAAGGSSGNSTGEFWWDTSSSPPLLKIFNGTSWVITGGAYIEGNSYTAKGDLISASAPSTPVVLSVGTDGQILAANSTTTTGLEWIDNKVGTVTSITAGTGLDGGAITVSGTIDLADTAVTPGTYTYSTFTVDQQGRITSASSGTDAVTAVTGTAPIQVTAGLTPVVSVDAATTAAAGAVQLYDATDSTSTSLALTAAQGKVLQDQIDALAVSNNLTFAGTIDASTGLLLTVSAAGTATGFTSGSALPSAAAGNAEYFVITEVAGTFTPPGGSPTLAHQGDWFLSNGTSWDFLDIGFSASAASDTVAGIVELATNAETQTGTDATRAVTPASLQSKVASDTAIGLIELATDAETQAGTDAVRAVTPASLQSKVASDTAIGLVELATDAETQAGTDTTRAVTPANLQSKVASDTAIGLVELATNAETQAGTDATLAVTPAGLQSKVASDTAIGLVELATNAETQTGTDATLAVTPAGLQSKVASDTAIGLVELATSAETQAGTDATLAVTPAGLQSKVATDTAIGLVELATDAETQAGTDTTRAVTPAGLQSRVASDTASGFVELATDAETQAGTDATRAVTPAGLQSKVASDTVIGLVELATDAETQAGTDATLAVTPASLQSKVASDTAIGLVELATDAETQAGTDTTLAVTPAGLQSKVASTTAKGLIQLATNAEVEDVTCTNLAVTPSGLQYIITDSTSTNSSTQIASSAAVCAAFQASTGCVSQNDFTAAGEVLVGTGAGTYSALPVGTDGQFIIADSTCTAGLKWADLSASLPGASDTVAGLVELATDAETQAGTDTTLAVTPAGLQSKVASTTALGIVELATTTETRNAACTGLAVTPAGLQAIITDSTSTNSSTDIASSSAVCLAFQNAEIRVAAACYQAPGDLVVGCGGIYDYCTLNVGGNGSVLTADSACAGGLKWGSAPISGADFTAKGELLAGTGAGTSGLLSLGTNGFVLVADPATSTGLLWAKGATAADFTARGQLLVGEGAGDFCTLSVGTNGQILVADSTCTGGLKWVDNCVGTVTSVTAGTGITDSGTATDPVINLADTAVTPGSYSYAAITVDQQGRLTAASDGTSPVLSVTGGTAISISGAGDTPTVNLDDTAVTPGSYTYGSFTVDQQGRITAASSGTDPVTAVSGGTAITSTGGTTPSLSLDDTAVTPGSYTNATLTVDQQGRLTAASSGTAPVTAVTGSGGISSSGGTTPDITLDNTAVTAGTYANASLTVDAQGRLTAASANPDPLACSLITAKGDLLVGTAASTATALGVGADTYVLTANSACAGGIEWATAPPPAGTVAEADYTAKGDILVASAASTPTALPVGSNGQVLVANSACTTGVEWATPGVAGWTTATATPIRATGSNPNQGTWVCNWVSYRQLGPTSWEVWYNYWHTSSTGFSSGSGDYLFRLPAGLTWDTSAPNQAPYTGDVGNSTLDWVFKSIPGCGISTYGTTSRNDSVMSVTPYNSNCFRVVTDTSASSTYQPMGSGWYDVSGQAKWALNLRFTFESA